MTTTIKYNRVLLNEVGFLRSIRTKDKKGMVRDGSALTYQIEELIALGAVEVAIQDWPANRSFRDSLSPLLRCRVRLIDEEFQCLKRAQSIFMPIAEELSLRLDFGSLSFKKELDRNVQWAVSALYFSLQSFLLGVEHDLQIDINLGRMKDSVDLLRRNQRSPEARAITSVLSGILSTYEPAVISSAIELYPMAPPQLISLFEEFVQDETYRQLSEASHDIGVPRRARRAITMVGRYAKKLIEKPAFRKVADLSSKTITMATQVPVPDSEICNTILTPGYLPPIVSLRKALDDAQSAWKAQRPEILFPPSALENWKVDDVEDDFSDGD